MAIRITAEGDKLSVNPETENVKNGGSTKWIVDVPADREVAIEFADEGGVPGPFAYDTKNPKNKGRGRYQGGNGDINSNKADQASGTSWKYDVVLLQGKKEIDRQDPFIKIVGS